MIKAHHFATNSQGQAQLDQKLQLTEFHIQAISTVRIGQILYNFILLLPIAWRCYGDALCTTLSHSSQGQGHNFNSSVNLSRFHIQAASLKMIDQIYFNLIITHSMDVYHTQLFSTNSQGQGDNFDPYVSRSRFHIKARSTRIDLLDYYS